jgi:hypothetical protein
MYFADPYALDATRWRWFTKNGLQKYGRAIQITASGFHFAGALVTGAA